MSTVRGLITLMMLAAAPAAAAGERLPAYTGDPNETSVSGLPSGAFMAVQYEIAFSTLVKGAGILRPRGVQPLVSPTDFADCEQPWNAT